MSAIDKTTLQYLYLEEKLTIRAIAEGFAVPPQVISEALIRWNIARTTPTSHARRAEHAFPFDEATLRHLYLEAENTLMEIADQLNVSRYTVVTAMKQWGIPRRRPGPYQTKRSRKTL